MHIRLKQIRAYGEKYAGHLLATLDQVVLENEPLRRPLRNA